MRTAAWLAALSLIAVAVSAAVLFGSRPVALDGNVLQQGRAIRAAFADRHAAVEQLNLASFAASRDLLDPAAALPQTHRYSLPELRALHRYAATCREPPEVSAALAKARTWAEAHCRGRAPPLDFYTRPPWMHPTGISFAQLARRDGFASPARYLHAVERDEESLLGRLGAPGLRATLHGESIVMGALDMLLLVRRGPPADAPVYDVFSRASWDAFASLQPLVLRPSSASGCLARTGQLCWVANQQLGARAMLGWQVAFAIAWLGLAVALGVIIVLRRRAARREADDRLFILRTLAHELRTPATAITLGVESLRRDFETLPDQARAPVLRLADQVQRLRRVLDATSRFSSVHRGEAGLERVDIPSINALVADVVLEEIAFDPLPGDASLRSDPHWLGVCTENLIANALAHGKAPVRVSVTAAGAWVHIEVADSGDSSHLALERAVTAFEKGQSSQGLGLGLSIVSTVMRDLGGELTHRPSPTTFVLRIPAPP